MIKSAIILFITCFLLYLPFSREPDYFDSETTPAIIELKEGKVYAKYSEFGKSYMIELDPVVYRSMVGNRIEVRYELSHPEKATVNRAWGYWFIAKEMGWSFGIFTVLLGVAFATTNKPHPDALAEQLSYKEEIKSKYQ